MTAKNKHQNKSRTQVTQLSKLPAECQNTCSRYFLLFFKIHISFYIPDLGIPVLALINNYAS